MTAGKRARRALEAEVLLTPKPGLVDQNNTGAHRDMDVETFLRSAAALEPWFDALAQAGAETAALPPEAVLPMLRPIGIRAEADMYAATGGVNTHKGALFSLGLLCAAQGRLEALNRPAGPEALCQMSARLAKGVTGELSQTGTHGLAAHAAYGAKGVRGEAESGFAAVRQLALPTLQKARQAGDSPRIAGVRALLALMAALRDTNVLHRAGEEGLTWLQTRARDCLSRFSLPAVEELDRACITRNISPGGSADLLAIAFFLEDEDGGKSQKII